VKSIESWAFDDCSSLEKIVIPYRVYISEHGTFNGCEALEIVRV